MAPGLALFEPRFNVVTPDRQYCLSVPRILELAQRSVLTPVGADQFFGVPPPGSGGGEVKFGSLGFRWLVVSGVSERGSVFERGLLDWRTGVISSPPQSVAKKNEVRDLDAPNARTRICRPLRKAGSRLFLYEPPHAAIVERSSRGLTVRRCGSSSRRMLSTCRQACDLIGLADGKVIWSEEVPGGDRLHSATDFFSYSIGARRAHRVGRLRLRGAFESPRISYQQTRTRLFVTLGTPDHPHTPTYVADRRLAEQGGSPRRVR
jgi:hypothetical protein